MRVKRVVLDYGHGGINTNGEYTTKGKMFKFSNGSVVYEGVINRRLGFLIKASLLSLMPELEVVETALGSPDIGLWERVRISNSFDSRETLLVSLHSNASRNHNASGFSIYTSIGETKADELARDIFTEVKVISKKVGFPMRRQKSDLDIEKNFYILRKTKCPAVLIETLFFDFYKDVKILRNNMKLLVIAEAIARGIVKYVNKQS